MRSTTLFISTLLCAGALAQPLQSNVKRDETKLVNEYQKDNTLVREYEVVHKVYVPAGGDSAPQQSEKAAVVQTPKQDDPPKKTYKHKSTNHGHGTWRPVQKQQAPPKQEAPKEEPKQEVKQEVKQPVQELQPKEDKKEDTSDSASSGNADLDIVNKMRKQWRPDLPPYKWSQNLYKNVKDCVDSSPNTMTHKLVKGSGSFGQVLAPTHGDLAEAMTMWLCESPGGSLPCPNGQTKGIGENPHGHADILSDTSHAYIACYGPKTGTVVGCDVGDA